MRTALNAIALAAILSLTAVSATRAECDLGAYSSQLQALQAEQVQLSKEIDLLKAKVLKLEDALGNAAAEQDEILYEVNELLGNNSNIGDINEALIEVQNEIRKRESRFKVVNAEIGDVVERIQDCELEEGSFERDRNGQDRNVVDVPPTKPVELNLRRRPGGTTAEGTTAGGRDGPLSLSGPSSASDVMIQPNPHP